MKRKKQNLSYEKSDKKTDKSVGMIAGERKIERNEQRLIEKKEKDWKNKQYMMKTLHQKKWWMRGGGK